MPHARSFFYRETLGIRITVRPAFSAEHSRPAEGRYVFYYAVRIENVGAQGARLLSRRWLIHDDAGEDTVKEGEGVIGEQPLIQPGCVHEYQSYCILRSTSGYMEGHYHFVRADGSEFDALIPRFPLEAGGVGGLFG